MKRLLTIGHSYVVAQNRRLAHEMAIAGEGTWDVTAGAPASLPGDLRHITLEPIAGERCRVAPLVMRAARSRHLRFYQGLHALFREPWDLVHCWEEPYVAAGWQIARRTPRGARLVVATFQNLPKRYPPPFSWMEQAVLRRADGWIPFGHTVRQNLAGRPGYAGGPARVIGPGVDTVRFAPDHEARRRIRARFGWDDAVPVVGFLGRFVEQKGAHVLMSALAALERPWRALFVGSGPERAALQSFSGAYPGRVAIAEGVTHDDVPGYLNAMDVLCAPSRTTARWREQFGRMLIEAMACGVPVVASNSGEIPHVVGRAGLVLPEGEIAPWVEALGDLLGDDARRAGLRAAGLERVREEFAWPVVARKHLEFFETVIAS